MPLKQFSRVNTPKPEDSLKFREYLSGKNPSWVDELSLPSSLKTLRKTFKNESRKYDELVARKRDVLKKSLLPAKACFEYLQRQGVHCSIEKSNGRYLVTIHPGEYSHLNWLARVIHKKNGSLRYDPYISRRDSSLGSYSSGAKQISLNFNDFKDTHEITTARIHEFGHLMDDIRAKLGKSPELEIWVNIGKKSESLSNIPNGYEKGYVFGEARQYLKECELSINKLIKTGIDWPKTEFFESALKELKFYHQSATKFIARKTSDINQAMIAVERKYPQSLAKYYGAEVGQNGNYVECDIYYNDLDSRRRCMSFAFPGKLNNSNLNLAQEQILKILEAAKTRNLRESDQIEGLDTLIKVLNKTWPLRPRATYKALKLYSSRFSIENRAAFSARYGSDTLQTSAELAKFALEPLTNQLNGNPFAFEIWQIRQLKLRVTSYFKNLIT